MRIDDINTGFHSLMQTTTIEPVGAGENRVRRAQHDVFRLTAGSPDESTGQAVTTLFQRRSSKHDFYADPASSRDYPLRMDCRLLGKS